MIQRRDSINFVATDNYLLVSGSLHFLCILQLCQPWTCGLEKAIDAQKKWVTITHTSKIAKPWINYCYSTYLVATSDKNSRHYLEDLSLCPTQPHEAAQQIIFHDVRYYRAVFPLLPEDHTWKIPAAIGYPGAYLSQGVFLLRWEITDEPAHAGHSGTVSVVVFDTNVSWTK